MMIKCISLAVALFLLGVQAQG